MEELYTIEINSTNNEVLRFFNMDRKMTQEFTQLLRENKKQYIYLYDDKNQNSVWINVRNISYVRITKGCNEKEEK